MLYQALGFGSMMTAGVVLFAVSASIEADRAAFTSVPVSEPAPLVTRVSAAKSEPVEPQVEEAAPMMMLPPIEIVAPKRSQRAAVPNVTSEPAMVAQPCSDWQELGPQRVEEGNGIGLRRVRSLCFGPAVTAPADK